MDSAGQSCFPSIDKLVKTTSLSRKTVIKYLNQAKEDGWIKIEQHGFKGKKWKRNEYAADIPDSVQKRITENNNLIKPAYQPKFKIIKRLKARATLNESQIGKIVRWLQKNQDKEEEFSAFLNAEIENVLDMGAVDYKGRKIENIQAWSWTKLKKIFENGIPNVKKNERGF